MILVILAYLITTCIIAAKADQEDLFIIYSFQNFFLILATSVSNSSSRENEEVVDNIRRTVKLNSPPPPLHVV
jgi:hypothetical protein